MKQIPVSFGEFALIDDEDYSEVSKYSWTTQKRATKTNKVAVRAFKKGDWWTNEALHRFITKVPYGMYVLFKDGNGLNCQKDNMIFMKNGTWSKNRKKNDNLQGL